MEFQDRAPLEKVRKLADGRLAAVAKIARSGVYRYSGGELGRPDLGTVNVYRPESEVFDQASLASFAHKSVTLGHPTEAVTADNWRKHSVGYSEGKIARDGDYIEIPLMLADAAAVAAVENGTAKQISAGYHCELVWGSGVAPTGERFDATQRHIVADHIAIVPEGRAGPECRIGDASAAFLTDEERGLAVAKAVRDHALKYSYLPSPPPFSDSDKAAAIEAAAKGKASNAAFVSRMTADTASTRAAMNAMREARKAEISSGWKS